MSILPGNLPLAPGDYFMHGQDRRMRNLGLPGNVCRIAIHVGPGLDLKALRQRIEESPLLTYLAQARVVRSFPLFPPRWRITKEECAFVFEHTEDQRVFSFENGENPAQPPRGIPAVVAQRDLNPADGPGIAFDLVRNADGSAQLVLSWSHTLMDARGAEFVLRHLNPCAIKNVPGTSDLINPSQLKRSLAERWRRLNMAHSSMQWLRESGADPLFSLLPSSPPAGPRNNQLRLIAFDQEQTARIDARSQCFNAGFQRSHFYLASAIRGLHAIAARRGNTDGAYLAPVPHDMRRRGSNGPIFSNQLSILFYRIEPQLAGNLGQIVAELNRQMMNQIRSQFPDSCMAALDLFKPLPLDYYVRHLGQPTRGKFATLCFSDSGETCAGMTDWMGVPIQRVVHWVPTWRPPGLTVLFWRHAAKLNTLLSWVDDCMDSEEVNLLEKGLRAGLLEEVVP